MGIKVFEQPENLETLPKDVRFSRIKEYVAKADDMYSRIHYQDVFTDDNAIIANE